MGMLGFLLVLDYGNMAEPAQMVGLFVEKQGFIYLPPKPTPPQR